jgi:alpha-glucosidase
MVDPAVSFSPNPAYIRGVEDNVFLKRSNGSEWLGVVWPGVSVFPDWFSTNITNYWNNEFALFFSKDSGIDIDSLWIDMNEPSNFPCFFPCDDPFGSAVGFPPTPPPVRSHAPRPMPGFPCELQPEGSSCKRSAPGVRDIAPRPPAPFIPNTLQTRSDKKWLGLPNRDLLFPKYAIHNKAAYQDSWNAEHGGISNKTVLTNVIHQNGLAEYDVHNLYGTSMQPLHPLSTGWRLLTGLLHSDVDPVPSSNAVQASRSAPSDHNPVHVRRGRRLSGQVAGR